MLTPSSNKTFSIGDLTFPAATVMAPMCGISDSPWRRLCRRFGAGVLFTEMASSEALIRDKERSHQLLGYQPEEQPIVMQMCGSREDVLAEAAKIMEGMGAAIIDLNMGCPVKKIVAQGAGSALLLDLPRVGRILRAMVEAVKIPVTLKIRAGWDERQMTAIEVARIAEESGCKALSIHARTRAQAFSGHADWRIIKALVESTKLPVIGNGDVNSPEAAERMLRETGCAAVMVGRGAQGRPWIFREILDPNFQISDDERYRTIREHYETALEFYGRERGLRIMRKHLAWYSHGLDHGSTFREQVVRITEADDVFRHIDEFFGRKAEQSAASLEVPASS